MKKSHPFLVIIIISNLELLTSQHLNESSKLINTNRCTGLNKARLHGLQPYKKRLRILNKSVGRKKYGSRTLELFEKKNDKFWKRRKFPENRRDNEIADILLGETTENNGIEGFQYIEDLANNYLWPILPGPITCESRTPRTFPAESSEYDFVVSMQLIDESHANSSIYQYVCTCIAFDKLHVVTSAHCLRQYCKNFENLSVVTDRDLCHIKNVIPVESIFEHENFNAITRNNDIAVVKLQSEINVPHAALPSEDNALGSEFFAVGYGEIVWKKFEVNVSKLIQKVPVQRHRNILKEQAGTVFVSMDRLDLTGTKRGDFGGALINYLGEVVGLHSRTVTSETNYDVYIRLKTYLPWIESVLKYL